MRRNVHFCVLAVVCALAVGCTSKNKTNENAEDKDAKPLDTSFIPDDAFAVLVAHPAKMLESKLFAKLPLDEPLREMQEDFGLDPRNVEQVVVPIYPGFRGRPAVVIRTKKPYDKEKIGGRDFTQEKRREAEHEGKKYFQSVFTFSSQSKRTKEDGATKEKREEKSEPTGKAMYFVDDSTLIMGDEESLKKMISAEKADSELVKQIKAAELHDIVIFSAFTDFRDDLMEISNSPGDGTQEDKLFKWAAKHVQTVSFWADVDPEIAFHLAIDSDDEAGGAQLKKYVDEKISQAEGAVQLFGPELLHSKDSPFSADVADKAIKLGREILAAINTKDEGKSFAATFTEPENAREVIDEVIPVLGTVLIRREAPPNVYVLPDEAATNRYRDDRDFDKRGEDLERVEDRIREVEDFGDKDRDFGNKDGEPADKEFDDKGEDDFKGKDDSEFDPTDPDLTVPAPAG